MSSAVEQQKRFEQWCILELMGHVKLAGLVTEEERFGAKMGRIDIPGPYKRCDGCGGHGTIIDGNDTSTCSACAGQGKVPTFVTQYFGGSSVYRLTPTLEEVAKAVASRHQPAPVHAWELPAQLTHRSKDYGVPDDCDDLPDGDD